MTIFLQQSCPAGVEILQNWIFWTQPGLGHYNCFPDAQKGNQTETLICVQRVNQNAQSTPQKKTKTKIKMLSINIQQPVKIVHFQELNSLIDFMDGQEMGGSLHILLLKTQLLGKGFHCPNPGLVSNCKREGNTIGGSFITGRIPVPYPSLVSSVCASSLPQVSFYF